jgi:hypothetical protein
LLTDVDLKGRRLDVERLDRPRGFKIFLGPPTSNDDRCPGRGQSLGDAKSNSGVAAGDDGNPSIQVEEVHRRRGPSHSK